MILFLCMKISKEQKKKLERIAGGENVKLNPEELILYSYDGMNRKFLPDAVVFPGNTEEVSEILKLANEEKMPVIPRGGGTGMVGGSVASEGGVILSLERMNGIIDIDAHNFTAVVEPGVITGDLHSAVEDIGLFYPPDPASLKFCTIGGNVATSAGGLRAVKYGVTKDYVIGLEVALPDGTVVSAGVRTLKGVVGYDLAKLFTGSEGTIGVITKIIMKLISKPESKVTLWAVFDRIEDSIKASLEVFYGKILPSTLEFMDKSCIKCVEEHLKVGLPLDAEAILLIVDDGDPLLTKKNGERIKDILEKNNAREVKIARDNEEEESFWKVRRSISPSLARLNPHKLNPDVTVPRSKLAEFVKGIHGITGKYNLVNANFGHIGDGNVHVNILYNRDNEEESRRAEKAVEEIDSLGVSLGGTISGEHGIGIAKLKYIGIELNEKQIEIMRKIKAVFDPNGIMNPNKIFKR